MKIVIAIAKCPSLLKISNEICIGPSPVRKWLVNIMCVSYAVFAEVGLTRELLGNLLERRIARLGAWAPILSDLDLCISKMHAPRQPKRLGIAWAEKVDRGRQRHPHGTVYLLMMQTLRRPATHGLKGFFSESSSSDSPSPCYPSSRSPSPGCSSSGNPSPGTQSSNGK